MQRYGWVIFDADGTLFDFERAELTALSSTFRQHGLAFDGAVHATFGEINGRLWRELELGNVSSEELRVRRFEELAEVLDLGIDAQAFSSEYLWNLGGQTQLIPGAEEVVGLVARTARLALATNGIAGVQRRRFASSSIRPFFRELVISEEVGAAKPASEFFVELFARIGNPAPSDVLMVGDSLSSDIKGGADFGMDTCWFNPARRANESPVEPTYEISDLAAVTGILGGAGVSG